VQYAAYIFRAESVLKQKQAFTTKRSYVVTFQTPSFSWSYSPLYSWHC